MYHPKTNVPEAEVKLEKEFEIPDAGAAGANVQYRPNPGSATAMLAWTGRVPNVGIAWDRILRRSSVGRVGKRVNFENCTVSGSARVGWSWRLVRRDVRSSESIFG